jgi:hypothetical protein
MSEELESGRITLSMPASRRKEFDAALLKLKQRRPFESISKIVSDAVIAAAVALENEAHEETQGNKKRPALAYA